MNPAKYSSPASSGNHSSTMTPQPGPSSRCQQISSPWPGSSSSSSLTISRAGPSSSPCGRDTTAAATIRQFRYYFRDVGVPVRLRNDGRSQFTSREFASFLDRWRVWHVISSPHYPQSNGHAEAAVKAVKHLIMKVAPSGNIDCEEFHRALYEHRNTPTHTERSPAQVLYGHPLRTCVPAHPEPFKKELAQRRATVELQSEPKMPRPPTINMPAPYPSCSWTSMFLCRLSWASEDTATT